MSYERRDVVGGAIPTTLSSGINSGATSFAIAVATGWPTGANGDFFVVIDRGTANEEKIRCASRSTLTVTVQTSGRGSDGTTGVAHDSGAAVEHCITAVDVDEANYAVVETVGKITTAGDLLVGDGTNSLTRLGIGTTGYPLVAGASTPAYGQVGTSGIADDAITSSKIVTDAVGSAEIAADAVGTSEIAADAVGTSEIAALAVTDAELAADSVITSKILNANVTTEKLAANAITLATFATQADQTVLGNRSGGAAVPSAMTAAQTMALLSGDAGAAFSMNSQKITSVATPTDATDAAIKSYVDKSRTHYEQTLPGAGNWVDGNTIASLTITDPGYNIIVWVSGTVAAIANTLAYWEMQVEVDGTKVGGIIIPHANVSTAQTYAILGRITPHTTGTDCDIDFKVNLFAGAGGFDTLANTGANNLLTAYYTWDGT